jgi:hypothetical protein
MITLARANRSQTGPVADQQPVNAQTNDQRRLHHEGAKRTKVHEVGLAVGAGMASTLNVSRKDAKPQS